MKNLMVTVLSLLAVPLYATTPIPRGHTIATAFLSTGMGFNLRIPSEGYLTFEAAEKGSDRYFEALRIVPLKRQTSVLYFDLYMKSGRGQLQKVQEGEEIAVRIVSYDQVGYYWSGIVRIVYYGPMPIRYPGDTTGQVKVEIIN